MLAKQSFAARRSQAGTWERVERVDGTTKLRTPNFALPCSPLILFPNSSLGTPVPEAPASSEATQPSTCYSAVTSPAVDESQPCWQSRALRIGVPKLALGNESYLGTSRPDVQLESASIQLKHLDPSSQNCNARWRVSYPA